jgi:isopenicillin-N N-acyltransferase-like protein
MRFPVSMAALCGVSLVVQVVVAGSDDKAKVITGGDAAGRTRTAFQSGADPGGGGYRTEVTNGISRVPVVVVGGTAYQRGWHFGRLMREEIRQFVPAVVKGFQGELKVDDATLDRVWAATAGHTDDRVEQEILGVADGSGLPVRTLQHAHCLPLLMPYSCSSIAAWGSATPDGHLYQTRNLDWSLAAGAHEFPVLLVQLPLDGQAHVMPTFAGVVGANCGMNAAGLVLSEIGDAGKAEAPYDIHAPHFTTWFRTLLYDATSLTQALDTFSKTPQTKRYHFVFGDGLKDRRAVKIRTDTRMTGADRIRIWADQEGTDELAPNVLSCVVYHDEGRGAFPALNQGRGKLDGPALVAIANSIPIKGGNVLNAVFDGTGLRLWVSYAGGELEAYQRPSVFLDLMKLDGDGDGRPDLVEGGADRDGNGVPDFLQR